MTASPPPSPPPPSAPEAILALLASEIAAGPDPAAAGARWQRFVEKGGVVSDEPAARLLAALLASGSFLPELLLADIDAWPGLAADSFLGQPKPAARCFAELEAATRPARDFADFKRRLRVYRRREMLRLGARELGWGTTEEVAVELSGLADACLELSVRFCDAALRAELGVPTASGDDQDRDHDQDPDQVDGAPSFVVLAMGKLGGEELNFSSDVDVVYFYSTDAGQVLRDGADSGRSLHGYFDELSRRITEALEESTPEGWVFRVDLRLRPEGRNGPLCNSLAAAERYYETFGRTWERQALLRARPCAGDRRLGARLLAMLDPFIYPRHIAPGMVDEIRNLRGQFRPKREGLREGVDEGFDVKLGSGGIRDVELVVQTLQLLHAGKRRDLRGRSTPRGLRRLELAGLLSNREARTLATAYRFWRQVEHRLQLRDGAQTHLVPADPVLRGQLARGLGFPLLEAFDRRVAERRAEVQGIADTFDSAEPGPSAREPGGAASPTILRLLAPALDRAELTSLLGELGFTDLDTTVDTIEMARGRLEPALIAEAVASPDPDRALARFRDLVLRGSVGLVGQLRDDPRLLRMLATLFGVSERLSRLLVGHPEMWEATLDGLGEPVRGRETLAAAAGARLSAADAEVAASADEEAAAADPDAAEEAAARALRRFAAEETLRIGVHDVAGNLTAAEVARQLTDLAEICVDRGIARILPSLVARYGQPSTSLTVLGLGSLGAYEMRYGSDLDLVFLYGADGQTDNRTGTGVGHQEFFSRLARRVINSFGAVLEEGRLYSIDTRLRPSGEQGLLVTSVEAFERYHQQEAAGWERVALLRARVVFSTAAPAERATFERTLGAITYERAFDAAAFGADMRRVREKVEAERGKVPAGSRHLRFDPGGIMDVEFLSALGQLTMGAAGPADSGLRTTETAVVLDRLIERGWPAALAGDYALLRALAMRMRLLRDRPEDVVGPADLTPLARSLERDPADLREDLDAAMKRVRTCFLQHFP